MVDKKKNIDKNHLCYELIEDNEKNQYILLRYALLFRRFDKVDEIIEKLENKNIDIEVEFKKKIQNYNVSMFDILSWNQGYFNSYIKKNGLKSKYLNKINTLNEDLFTYDDFIDLKNKETVFTLFFKFKNLPESVQNILRKKNDNIKNIDDKVIPPILDVEYYEKQLIASKQVKKNGCSLVMDEVGTGKTVTALYAIRDVIEEANLKGEKAKILIVAPSNKKEDWHQDIRRQLGIYSHIVNRSDDGELYEGDLKEIYFKEKEHCIFICGQKQSEADNNGHNSELKSNLNVWLEAEECTKWDLIIIDEGHQNFKNYWNLKSNRVMILTATPLIIRTEDDKAEIKKNFEDYKILMLEIIDKEKNEYNEEKFNILPLEIRNPTEENIFVNWFREDFLEKTSEKPEEKPSRRKILFEWCERISGRQECLNYINYIAGPINMLHVEQDDDYIIEKMKEIYDSITSNNNIRSDLKEEFRKKKEDIERKFEKNGKIEKLIEILNEDEKKKKSYLIFCEHKFVVKKIYNSLKEKFKGELNNKDLIIGYKTGDGGEVNINGVEDEEIINTIIQNIRKGKRGILILTSGIGGVGLNMGEFDGIINYELPFTSTQLEQRFGRIDRINNYNGKKEMIFLMNGKENEYSFEENFMFYYSTSKIDETSQNMPVRNTVLLEPNKINEIMKILKEDFEKIIKTNNKIIKEIECIDNYFKDKYSDEEYKKLKIKFSKGNINIFNENNEEEKLKKLENEIIKLQDIKKNQEILLKSIFYINNEREENEVEDEYKNYNEEDNINKIINENMDKNKEKYINKKINIEKEKERVLNLEEILNNKVNMVNKNSKHQVESEGIFYINGNCIENKSVDDFRNFE